MVLDLDSWAVEWINEWLVAGQSSIHGQGLFAGRAIRAGTPLIEYRGERITKAESARRCAANNPYIFALDDRHDLDGAGPDNPARWINHSCRPNCEAENRDGRIWITSCRDIAPGEEISFNYGYDLENYEEHPCRCGAVECVGFIVAEELFGEVRPGRGDEARAALS